MPADERIWFKGFPLVCVGHLPDTDRESGRLSSIPDEVQPCEGPRRAEGMDPGPEHKALSWSG